MELEIKRGLELLGKNKNLTSSGLNPIEPSPATTGLMNFRWKLRLGRVGIKVHLMAYSGNIYYELSDLNTNHTLLFQKPNLYCKELLCVREKPKFTICYFNACSRGNHCNNNWGNSNNNNNSCSSNSLLQLWTGQQAIKNSRWGWNLSQQISLDGTRTWLIVIHYVMIYSLIDISTRLPSLTLAPTPRGAEAPWCRSRRFWQRPTAPAGTPWTRSRSDIRV